MDGKVKSRLIRAVCIIMMFLSLCVLAVSVFSLVENMEKYEDGERVYSEAAQIFASAGMTELGSMSEDTAHKQKFEKLKQINHEIYGWIYIEGTDVNYPIARGRDNEYYLNRSYTGEYLVYGCIFADYRTPDDISESLNTVIYGHNWGNGTVFQFIERLQYDQASFDDMEIVISLPEGIYTYKPIATYETTTEDDYIRTDFKDGAELAEFVSEAMKRSTCRSDRSFTQNDRLLTLSTCTNRNTDGRYSLHAVLSDVKEIK